MFSQSPEIETINSNNVTKSPSALKSARRKRRKRAEKLYNKQQILKREKQRFANTMSSWAENFSMAATWQLKHQVAHWKSRAKALEYENSILRSMLRQYYVKGKTTHTGDFSEAHMSMSTQNESETGQEASEGEEIECDDDDDEQSQGEVREHDQVDGENMQISEEFINFLKTNVEFRKQRQEREKLRQTEKELPTQLLEQCPEAPTDKQDEYKKLYGAHWQRIAAVEMSILSKFISDCDTDKPVMWPTIPLRL